MSFNFLIDDEWHNNNFELVSDLTEDTKISRISISEDGTEKYYQRKTLSVYNFLETLENKIDIQQEELIEKSENWLKYSYGNLYKVTAMAVGVFSLALFSYNLYFLHPKIMKLMDLQKPLYKLSQAKNFCFFLNNKKVLKDLTREEIKEYLSLSPLINSEYLKGLKSDSSSNVLAKQASSIIRTIDRELLSINSESQKALEEGVGSLFISSLSMLGMVGAIYIYESLEGSNS